MKLTPKDFSGLRTTPDGLISILDVIGMVKGSSCNVSSSIWSKISDKCDLAFPTKSFKFPGVGNKMTPVTTFENIIMILSYLPGKVGKEIRSQQARIASLAIMRNQDTIVQEPAVSTSQDSKEVQSAHPVNPVLKLNLMKLTPEDFSNLRTTPNGLISVIDAIRMVKNSSYDVCKRIWSRISQRVNCDPNDPQSVPLGNSQGVNCDPNDSQGVNCDPNDSQTGNSQRVNCDPNDSQTWNSQRVNCDPNDSQGVNCDPNDSQTWNSQRGKCDHSEDSQTLTFESLVEKYQFSSRGGRPTPVATFKNIIVILSQLPGKEGKIIRDEQSNIAARAAVGDHDLEDALLARRQVLPAAGREALLSGVESSEEAKGKRSREAKEEQENPGASKRQHLESFLQVALTGIPEVSRKDVAANISTFYQHNNGDFMDAYNKCMDLMIKRSHFRKAIIEENGTNDLLTTKKRLEIEFHESRSKNDMDTQTHIRNDRTRISKESEAKFYKFRQKIAAHNEIKYLKARVEHMKTTLTPPSVSRNFRASPESARKDPGVRILNSPPMHRRVECVNLVDVTDKEVKECPEDRHLADEEKENFFALSNAIASINGRYKKDKTIQSRGVNGRFDSWCVLIKKTKATSSGLRRAFGDRFLGTFENTRKAKYPTGGGTHDFRILLTTNKSNNSKCLRFRSVMA